jgi:primosomal protein N' (replication factor Y)
MNIITVIPLSRSKIAEELIYFTSTDVPMGAIVTVPLRRKNIYAIVTKVEEAKDLKANIKNAPFEIRKLDKVKSTLFFPPHFIESCKILADYYATTIGAIIDTMVSNLILDNVNKIAPPLPPQASFDIPSTITKPKIKSRIFAIQGDDTDRMSSWRSLIRQEFASKRSIVIYVPTIEDCNRIFSAMEKGIEGYIFSLNSDLTSKKLISIWKTIAEIDHPIVVVATGSFPLLPRADVNTVIIEKENGRGWISQKAPYLDMRHAIETIAKHNKQMIYLADSILRLETLNAVENETIEEGSPFKWRSVSLARDSLIDMRPPKDSVKVSIATEKKEPRFKIISNELESLIKTLGEENTQLFIFANRRGLSPVTVCDDCGNIVMCKQCKATVVLHTSEETGKNFFMCHICGDRRSAEEDCLTCGSWRLTPLGIGIDRVYEEIRSCFKDVEIIKIDSDTTKTDKEVREAIEKFKSKPGSILLGTELAIQNFGDKVDHVAIVSLDSLFSLPDFRIQEKIMYTLVRLRAQATRSILVQTRKAEQKVFEYGLKGNLSDFYRTAVDERKQFDYPPFSTLVKITIEGKKDEIANTMADVAKFLEPHDIDIFPAFTATVRGKSIIHGLLKIATHAWPDPDLSKKLRSLPPNVMVKVNPESLL